MTLPAASLWRRRQLSTDICRRHRAAAKQLHVAAAIDRRDRQTDGRTDGRTHRRSALEASGANKSRVSVCIQTDNGAVVAVVAADAGARVRVDKVM